MPSSGQDFEEDHETLPTSSYALIELLDRRHPHQNIGRLEDPIDAHRRAAVREFIDGLVNAMLEDIEDMKSPVLDPFAQLIANARADQS